MKRYDSNKDSQLTFTDITDMFMPIDQKLQKELLNRVSNNSVNLMMTAKETVRAFQNVLLCILKVEKNVDLLKKQMMKRPLFDLDQAFKVINRDGYGKITAEDFKNALRTHGIYYYDQEIKSMFRRYDKDKDGMITYADFRQEFSGTCEDDEF